MKIASINQTNQLQYHNKPAIMNNAFRGFFDSKFVKGDDYDIPRMRRNYNKLLTLMEAIIIGLATIIIIMFIKKFSK